MALISIEDLAELDDEQLEDESTDSSETMDDGMQDRLLAHWRDVGRTHHVTVPRGTASVVTVFSYYCIECHTRRLLMD